VLRERAESQFDPTVVGAVAAVLAEPPHLARAA
jgi:hypothetical protein